LGNPPASNELIARRRCHVRQTPQLPHRSCGAQKLLIVGAGTPGLGTIKKPAFSLVAYSLG
jgi:hypothetical protein